MDAKQLMTLVVRPVLEKLNLQSRAAELLVIGTIYQESNGHFIKQVGGGPALGLIQMEPATYHDIWNNFLVYRRELASKITMMAVIESIDANRIPDVNQLVTNLAFAVAMCRTHYLRVKDPLPKADDIEGMAKYWKQHYNTHRGAGKVQEFIDNFPREVLSC